MTISETISLQSAVCRLWEWLDSVEVSQEEFTQKPFNADLPRVRALRSQVRIQPGQDVSLAWLRAQPHAQKLYFRSRDDSFESAAVGFAYVSSGHLYTKETHLGLVSILNPEYPQMKFYGASRFDSSTNNKVDLEWEPYSGFTFVLPAIEIYRDSEGNCSLAANYYPPVGAAKTFEALAMLQPLQISLLNARHSSLIPRANAVFDAPGFDIWDAAMKRILSDLQKDEYQKLVLAHRKKFSFQDTCIPDPFHVLAALDETNKKRHVASAHTSNDTFPTDKYSNGNQNMIHSRLTESTKDEVDISEESCDVQRSYLFCLQVAHGQAFISCTPEMLFRLEGRELKTEALAGTVRRGSDEKEAVELEQLLNTKNLDEHRYVVGHVKDILTECKVDIETSGPYVKKLARLMHLVTKVDGRFPGCFCNVPDKAYDVLFRMHPTPAVCGLPREKTKAEIRKFEGFDRGLFAGPLGWFSSEAAEFCVAIRSAVLYGNELTAFAGSGIVAGSEIKSEWEETELKMSALTDLFSRNGTEAIPYVNCRKEPHLHNVKEGIEDHNEKVSRASLEYNFMDIGPSRGNNPPSSIHLSRSSLSSGNDTLNTSGRIHDSEAITSPRRKPMDASELHLLPNLNALWASCCVEELCRNGVDTFFIAPGSRSAPLAVAAVTSRHARYFVSHDERGAGYLAVGFARATGRAAAVITSSGTAVANLLPAAVEANTDSLPLILLTADRPPELRDLGANQTIQQVGIFGTYALWSTDVPCPTENVPLRYILKNVDLAVRMSGSSTRTRELGSKTFSRGPVHINMMFRENLAPDRQDWDRRYVSTVDSRWRDSLNPATVYESSLSAPRGMVNGLEFCTCAPSQYSSTLLQDLKSRPDGVIVVGGGSGSVRTEDEAASVLEIAKILNWPVISDICGGIRLCREFPNLVHYADLLLCSSLSKSRLTFKAFLQFGERITSKRLLNLIQECSRTIKNFIHVIVSPTLKPSDPSLTATHRIEGHIPMFLATIEETLPKRRRHRMPESVARVDVDKYQNGSESMSKKMGELKHLSELIDVLLNESLSSQSKGVLTEPGCARVITKSLPSSSALFIGNSMPVRDFDCFAATRKGGERIRVAANRGASGIDGLLCTGIGFGIGLNTDVVVVVGDMSMMHDLNSLHLLREKDNRIPVSVTVVVVNNGGGGIFSMLPIAKHQDVFSPVFDTAHGIDFRGACSMFGIEYIPVRSVCDLQSAISQVADRHRLIEAIVPKDHGLNVFMHKKVINLIDERMTSALKEKLS